MSDNIVNSKKTVDDNIAKLENSEHDDEPNNAAHNDVPGGITQGDLQEHNVEFHGSAIESSEDQIDNPDNNSFYTEHIITVVTPTENYIEEYEIDVPNNATYDQDTNSPASVSIAI